MTWSLSSSLRRKRRKSCDKSCSACRWITSSFLVIRLCPRAAERTDQA